MVNVGTAALGCPPSEARLLYLAAAARPSTAPLPSPPSAAPLHSSLDPRHRTRRCPPPKFPRPPAPHRPLYRALRRHLLRCGSSARVGRESQLIASFCAACPE